MIKIIIVDSDATRGINIQNEIRKRIAAYPNLSIGRDEIKHFEQVCDLERYAEMDGDWDWRQVRVVFLHTNPVSQEGNKSFYEKQSKNAIGFVLISGDNPEVDTFEERWKIPKEKTEFIEVGLGYPKELNYDAFLEEWNQNPHSIAPVQFLNPEHHRREASKLDEFLMTILEPFEALGILIQGYLVIQDESPVPFLSEYLKREYGVLPDDESSAKAKAQTISERLVRPQGATEETGFYWFDECAPELEKGKVFCAEMDAIIKQVKDMSEYGKPSLNSILVSEVTSALRTVREIIVGNISEMEKLGWPNGFLDKKKSYSIF